MWDRVSVPLGMTQCLDSIYAAVLTGGIDTNTNDGMSKAINKTRVAQVCRSRFNSNFPNNVFNNSYALLYEIMVTFNVKVFTVEQIEPIIETNREYILSSEVINKKSYLGTTSSIIPNDDDILTAITAELKDEFIRLSNLEIAEEDFNSCCVMYTNWYRNTYMAYVCNNMAAIMSTTGLDVKLKRNRSRHYQGMDDAQHYYNDAMAIINGLSEETQIRHEILDEHWLEKSLQDDEVDDKLELMTIGIPEIDAAWGYLRRGEFLGVMGPPKGAKTRFSNYLACRAQRLGLNVAIWPVEGGQDEWEANQVACHIAFDSYEEALKRNTNDMVLLESSFVLGKKYVSNPTMRKAVAATKTKIATYEKYGRVSYITGVAYEDTFLDVLEHHYKNVNPYDIIIMDSIVNISSNTKGKVERIADSYMKAKIFVKSKLKVPALMVCTAQLKQETVDYMRHNPEAVIDVTAGAESAETIRTPDRVLGLFSDEDERKANIMRFYSVACRHTNAFSPFRGRGYLGSCFFCSSDDK